ncbi:hypothetical protein Tco_0542584 [Tanacetum coccineum]
MGSNSIPLPMDSEKEKGSEKEIEGRLKRNKECIRSLQIKYPIIDWEVHSEDTMSFWKIIRVGNHTEVYQVFEDMLKNFDREDLDKLWSLVKERFNSPGLTDDKEKELWVELKRLFEPDDINTLEEANNI